MAKLCPLTTKLCNENSCAWWNKVECSIKTIAEAIGKR